MPEETEIQKLLRLKRFEQPPEGYFDDFLDEFQRRQRTELLKRPVWQILRDRAGAFFEQFSVPQYAYGAASAAVLVVAGVLSFGILTSDPSAQQFASGSGSGQPVSSAALVYSPGATGEDSFSDGNFRQFQTPASGQPRYVIDARPVSYEAPFSF